MDETSASPMPLDRPAPRDDSPRFTVRRPLWTAIQLFADGVRLKRKGLIGSTFLLPMPDGSTKPVHLGGVFSGATVTMDGFEHRVEPKLPTWAFVLSMAPLVLVVGGALGGIWAVLGTIINLRVSNSGAHPAIKVAWLIVVAGVVGVACLVILSGFGPRYDPLANLAPRVCVDGVRADLAYDPAAVHIVSCNGVHDSEVFGKFAYTASTTYPGFDTLQAYAETVCFPAFEEYVGISTFQSVVGILPLLPSEAGWASSDRTILCFGVLPDGTRLTGSIRDTRR